MAKRSEEDKIAMAMEDFGSSTPNWPTAAKMRFADGRVVGTDNSVWLYRSVPLAPVVDAPTAESKLAPAVPLQIAFEELANLASTRMGRRVASKGGYRNAHLLLVNIPQEYDPPRDHPSYVYLDRSYDDAIVKRRLLLFGVQLRDSMTSRGLTGMWDSFVQTATHGGAPLEDFDADFRRVSAALARSGLTEMTQEEFRLAEAWWNHGRASDTTMLPHANHLHVFRDTDSARIAKNAGAADCHGGWPEGLQQHALTMASVAEIEMENVPATSPAAMWVNDLLHQMGAVAVSIRGLVEPAKITRNELRRNKKKYLDDINERVRNNKLSRAEQDEMLDDLTVVEAAYAGGGPPTLVETSVVVALDGRYEDVDELSRSSNITLASMDYQQLMAMSEMHLASSTKKNPLLHDLPTPMVAFSGLPSLSVVGDGTGIMLGFSELDRQPAYLAPSKASDTDQLPISLIVGQTGSGKLLERSTNIPTPSGWTTMGELKVGDEVLGRDGKPCRVTFLSDINERPDLYRIHFSDGQTIDADADHQWVVSEYRDRNTGRHPKRVNALATFDEAQRVIAELERRAQCASGSVTSSELRELVRDLPFFDFLGEQYAYQLKMMLEFVGVPPHTEVRVIERDRSAKRVVTKRDPSVLFPAVWAFWTLATAHPGGGNASRWADSLARRHAAAFACLSEIDDPDEWINIREVLRRLNAHGAAATTSRAGNYSTVLRSAGVPEKDVVRRRVQVWDAQVALKGLATRLSQQHSIRPSDEHAERRMTTAEMIDRGVIYSKATSRFAIRVPAALELPDADLPVPPYVLGAWLGDGSSNGGGFTGVDREITDYIENEGYTVTHHAEPKSHHIKKIAEDLRSAGVLNNKHIPAAYLRASRGQRLAVLQGLMDTDGSISKGGACELTLCDKRLANDALELIRSLGIKCAMTENETGYTITHDDGTKNRVMTGTRYRMKFTTDQPVFRLPRKAARVPRTIRETQRWTYITKIEKIPSRPGLCIQVDSPDHTYLAAGFIPTSNTVVMQWIADQAARLPNRMGQLLPTVMIDPKNSSDLQTAVDASGGRTYSLDQIAKSDGVFDPVRFSASREVGVELAASLILQINPFGTNASNYEVPLQKAISYGVIERGATCTGQALRIAAEAGVADQEMVRKIMDIGSASPMFSGLVGQNAEGVGLAMSEGLTYIKVGAANFDLPDPADKVTVPPLGQRVNMAMVKAMVYGSMMALANRQGVLLLDEAWVFLGAGRAELEKVGRLARSMQVLPILFTQRVSDALNAGLAGYISRGLILSIKDETEALAACQLFGIDPTPEMMARITAQDTIGGAPNWNSLRALKDPRSGSVLRGSVGIYADLEGRRVPVEIKIPPDFFLNASTNPLDIRKRERLKRELEAAEAAEAARYRAAPSADDVAAWRTGQSA